MDDVDRYIASLTDEERAQVAAAIEQLDRELETCCDGQGHDWSEWHEPSPPDSQFIEAEQTCRKCGAAYLRFREEDGPM